MPDTASNTHHFRAKIYRVGINLCVKVPFRITGKMQPIKGYIPVKGEINQFPFEQTLVPVKNDNFRLYVNGIMLKGSDTSEGDTASFSLVQTLPRTAADHPMPEALKKALEKNKLLAIFESLTPYRKKEILRYLNYLKTDEAKNRNILKVIAQLKLKK